MHFLKSFASALLIASASAASIPWGPCSDLSGVELPLDTMNETNRLPPPSAGLKLVRVAFGIGTQNYTCKDRTKPPALVGALAKLYNANPFACQPEQLAEWPRALVQTTASTQLFIEAAVTRFLNMDVFVGEHFFADATTPTFNFEARSEEKTVLYGNVTAKIPAPKYACKGKAPDNHGAVPWLKIDAKNAKKTGYSSVGYQEAYRVNTAGGAAPASCEGMPEMFEVPYTTTYYFYN